MRKLASVCLSFSAAVFIAAYSGIVIKPLFLITVPAVIISFLIIFKRKKLNHHYHAFWALFFFIFGFAFYSVFSKSVTENISCYYDNTICAEAIASDYSFVYDDYSRTEIIVNNPDGRNFRALFYDYYSAASMEPGDRISFTAVFKDSGIKYGEEYDYYYTKGIYAIINNNSFVQINKSTDWFSKIRFFPVIVKKDLSLIIEKTFNEETAPFMKSIMTGDKTDFYKDISHYYKLQFSGLSHIIAVSGMHIAYLISLIQLFFGRNKRSSIFAIIMLWLFTFITGNAPSTVRAAFMQTLLLFAPILKRENDSLTSMSLALSLILLQNPFSALSTSLHLSFAAVGGILLINEKAPHTEVFGKSRIVKYVGGTVINSVAVTILTLPVMALHFKYAGIFSILSNVLALWAVPIVFCAGYISIFFNLIPGIAMYFMPKAVGLLVKYIFFVSGLISSIPFSVVFFRHTVLYIWLAVSVTVTVIYLINCKFGNRNPLIPLLIITVTLCSSVLFVSKRYSNAEGVFTVLDVGQGQSIVLKSGDYTAVVDCGNEKNIDNAGLLTAEYLKCRNITCIDALVLTHLHSDHINGIEVLLELVNVNKVYIPDTKNETDIELIRIITDLCSAQNTEVITVTEDGILSGNNLEIHILTDQLYENDNNSGLILLASVGNFDMLITGDSSKKVENRIINKIGTDDCEILIVGHHGSRYSSSGEFLSSIGGNTAIISTGYNNYGHPTYETLERLRAYGYDIYRTDLNGCIEVFIK